MTGRIKIIRKVSSVVDGRRQQEETEFYSCWCEVKSLGTNEKYAALQTGLENTIVFETRTCDKMEEIRLNLKEFYVTLWDLGEVDENFSDDDAEGVTLSLQVTIFSESDEVELAREIKKLMKEKDFSFEGRNGDDSKPEDGIYMKAQRFSKFYEMEE